MSKKSKKNEKTAPYMAPAIQVGGVPKAQTKAMAKAIVKVATCSAVPEVNIKALDVLLNLGRPMGTTIQNCTFTAKGD